MQRNIQPLTGLRGLAAVWVMIYHAHAEDVSAGPGAVLLQHGYLAVDVFFVLSGFVMALSYGRLFAAGAGLRNYSVFLIRRFARVYPLYAILTLIAAALYFAEFWPNLSRLDFGLMLLQNLFLVQGWGFGWPFDGPSWSISTELVAYLLFPALALLTIYARPSRAALVALACYGALVLLTQAPTPATYRFPRYGPLDISWEHSLFPLVRCLLEFTIGLSTYAMAQLAAVRRVFAGPAIECAVMVALVAALLTPGSDVVAVLLVPPLILLLAVGNGPTVRTLALPPMELLGNLSYAIYLLHYVMKELGPFVARHLEPALGHGGAQAGGMAVYYGSVLVAAWWCFHLIEAPARARVRRFEQQLFPIEDRSLAASEAAGVRRVRAPG